MNERTTLCVGSWQAATSLGITEIIDDTEHLYALSLYSWFNMEEKRYLEKRFLRRFRAAEALRIFIL